MSDYATVKIPVDVANIADKIQKKKELGYKSRASVVVDGIRRLAIEFGIIRKKNDIKKPIRKKKKNNLDDFSEED